MSNNRIKLAEDAKFATSLWDKSLGLINPKNPRTLIFKTRFGIHTFFLKEPIDVVVLDKSFKVVKLKENLKPNRLFFWNPKYFYVCEIPEETIKQLKIEIGNRLDFCN